MQSARRNGQRAVAAILVALVIFGGEAARAPRKLTAVEASIVVEER